MAQRPLIAVPRKLLDRKPPHGSPCNHCGLCCWSKKCDVSRALFGAAETERPACPALRFDTQGNSHCDVVANPEKYTDADPDEARAAAKLLLYAGQGCTMRINGEMNHDFNLRMCGYDAAHRNELDDAMRLWKLPTDGEKP